MIVRLSAAGVVVQDPDDLAGLHLETDLDADGVRTALTTTGTGELRDDGTVLLDVAVLRSLAVMSIGPTPRAGRRWTTMIENAAAEACCRRTGGRCGSPSALWSDNAVWRGCCRIVEVLRGPIPAAAPRRTGRRTPSWWTRPVGRSPRHGGLSLRSRPGTGWPALCRLPARVRRGSGGRLGQRRRVTSVDPG